MSKKDEKKQVVVPTTEIEQIKILINKALVRVISGKTKRTYKQEVEFIANSIQKYIRISYIPKDEHNKELITQVFGYINCFKDLKNNVKGKTDKDKGYRKALDKVIGEFESLIYRKK